MPQFWGPQTLCHVRLYLKRVTLTWAGWPSGWVPSSVLLPSPHTVNAKAKKHFTLEVLFLLFSSSAPSPYICPASQVPRSLGRNHASVFFHFPGPDTKRAWCHRSTCNKVNMLVQFSCIIILLPKFDYERYKYIIHIQRAFCIMLCLPGFITSIGKNLIQSSFFTSVSRSVWEMAFFL